MSAPTPAPGDENPREGYYPDPSIPGYVRYWNGTSWVPGTSRPAPQQGGTPPATPPAPVDETGPMYFDEVVEAHDADGGGGTDAVPGRPGPAPAWQADTSRQTGFGGERDHRVSWGGPDPRTPGPEAPPGAQSGTPPATPPTASAPAGGAPAGPVPTDPRWSDVPDPTRGALPGAAARPPTDGTVTIRSVPPAGSRQPPALTPSPTPPQAQPPGLGTPPAPGPGGGSAAWPQPAHQLAQPERPALPQPALPQPQQQGPVAVRQQGVGPVQQQPVVPLPQQGVGPVQQQPVVPWKPPADDPFQHLVRSQTSARPAGLGKRLAARLLDTVVLGVFVGAIGFPLVTRATDHIDQKIEVAKASGETVTVWLLDATTAGLFGGVIAAFLILGFVLEALPTAKWGRTLGKKLCGLEVRDIETHDSPSLGAALRRWLVYGVLGLVLVGMLNVLWCLIDRPWRQCWHDKAARTFVAG